MLLLFDSFINFHFMTPITPYTCITDTMIDYGKKLHQYFKTELKAEHNSYNPVSPPSSMQPMFPLVGSPHHQYSQCFRWQFCSSVCRKHPQEKCHVSAKHEFEASFHGQVCIFPFDQHIFRVALMEALTCIIALALQVTLDYPPLSLCFPSVLQSCTLHNHSGFIAGSLAAALFMSHPCYRVQQEEEGMRKR